jgi:hypothetical protein
MRYQLARPSLKITGRTEEPRESRFTYEVWNPFLRVYQPVASVEEGVLRIGELADLIGRMWTRQHPKLALLQDVPEPDLIDRARWAELRINPTIQRGCDTRQDDHPAWEQAVGMVQATATICERVGCMPGAQDAPHHAAAQGRGMFG